MLRKDAVIVYSNKSITAIYCRACLIKDVNTTETLYCPNTRLSRHCSTTEDEYHRFNNTKHVALATIRECHMKTKGECRGRNEGCPACVVKHISPNVQIHE